MSILAGMDEILIEDRKYISSKQASKLTGYAKDYVGQLCREGRVPARLVGRSWYVLESAIKDHRFGTPDRAQSEVISKPDALGTDDESALQTPQYKAVIPDVLPTLPQIQALESEEGEATTESALHGTWREWFDRLAEISPEHNKEISLLIEEKSEDIAEEVESVTDMRDEVVEIEDGVAIPIHTLYDVAQGVIQPEIVNTKEEEHANQNAQISEDKHAIRVANKGFNIKGFVQALAISLGVFLATLAVAGSGYFDNYIISFKPAHVITGITYYIN